MHYTIRIVVDQTGKHFTARCAQLRGWFYPFHVSEPREEVMEGIRESIARFRYPEPGDVDKEVTTFNLRLSAEELQERARTQYAEFARNRQQN